MAGLLNVGEMASLALHALLRLTEAARRDPESRISVATLAEGLAASTHTLHKVIKRLASAGLVDGARGPSGGVRLAVAARRVTIMEIMEAVDGRAGSNACLFQRRLCPADASCAFAGLTQGLEDHVRDYYLRTTLQDLADAEGEAMRRGGAAKTRTPSRHPSRQAGGNAADVPFSQRKQ